MSINGSVITKEDYQRSHVITLERLISQVEDFIWEDSMYGKEFTEFKITESFDKKGTITYKLYNLEAELVNICDGQTLVMFDDLEHELKEDYTRVLNIFHNSSVIEYSYEWDKHWEANITFKDGCIKIERL